MCLCVCVWGVFTCVPIYVCGGVVHMCVYSYVCVGGVGMHAWMCVTMKSVQYMYMDVGEEGL